MAFTPKKRNFFDRLSGGAATNEYDDFDEADVIRAFVAGVRADELSLSISRDMVVIEGSRESREQIADPDYFSQELFWGSFTRTVLLPQEIDVDNSSATSKDGLLTIMLPKLDKARQTKLKVRAG
jgi:HSP20 family protein